jgi:hypothetical protein
MEKLRIVSLGLALGRRWPLNDGRIPNFRVVRVHVSTGYSRVEGNRRASRNGRVSVLPPEGETPHVTIRNCRMVSVSGCATTCRRTPWCAASWASAAAARACRFYPD